MRPYLKNWFFSSFKGIALGDFWVLRSKKGTPFFIYYLIQSSSFQKVANDTSGTKMPRSDWKRVSKAVFFIPNINEQVKIGKVLFLVDNFITLQQQQLDLYTKLKKGLLQKLFPKDGEKVPEIRFADFHDDWEYRKLKDIAEFINGKAFKQSELLSNGRYPVLRVGNFNTNTKWYFSNLELPKKNYVDDGDLLYTWATAFGPHIWHGPKVIFHYHIWKIVTSDSFNKNFALQVLEYDKKQLTNDLNGSTMVHITKKNMEEKIINIPSLKEQKKVSKILSLVDNQINLQHSKLRSIETLKKYLLQKLFI